ncbi:zinc ribbon domain-containing protein [Acidiferrimicrobium sp. IK]|uniref:FmdB family zinc ribbon protein n=1 Tax=Acidiferrimicrobium sp. IK TaxID=2871700 RepID=UPI0039678956|nr:zinc ribbon domain-containing protein [Acidiferrimicrobium sp. IK]
MPVYEYRCQTCDTRFDLRRAVAEADRPAPCPSGHADSRRLLSVFAAGGRTSAASPALGGGGGGGCCGGGCGCGPG